MKLGSWVVLLALVAAPACGGGGAADPGGSPTPLDAGFIPDQSSPAANDVAMALGANSNDVVTVNVTLTDVNGFFATAFEVAFDGVHLAYVGFSPGSIVEQGDSNPTYSVVSAASGRLVVGVSHTGSTTTNVSGTNTVVGLQFRVKQAGVYPLVIENQIVYDGQDPPQAVQGIEWFAGAVTGI